MLIEERGRYGGSGSHGMGGEGNGNTLIGDKSVRGRVVLCIVSLVFSVVIVFIFGTMVFVAVGISKTW